MRWSSSHAAPLRRRRKLVLRVGGGAERIKFSAILRRSDRFCGALFLRSVLASSLMLTSRTQ